MSRVSPESWCDVCGSWRYTAGNCGRDDCPRPEVLPPSVTAGMQRAFPQIKPDDLRGLIAQWRRMAEGQSFLMASTFEKCASDLERLLL